ncbi:HD domain-containing protein [Arcobacter vandammei]|uniref:[protein-PII] uridylyltransferase family protein n=1 Tax=Arcobacter vandammei TaxID=2782243 RepID=UPI0018DFF4F0|nr:HD domain-containing protein [Arcobacter vandammei]
MHNNLKNEFEVAKQFKEEYKNYLISQDIKITKEFFLKQTKETDYFLLKLYNFILEKHFLDFKPTLNQIPICFVALGSYGREQLCLYSDIDIMILYKDIKAYNSEKIIENFVSFAWDCGLNLGLKVVKIDDISNISLEDITIKTSLLESRFIFGSFNLYSNYEKILEKIRLENQKTFLEEKLLEHKNRLLKYPLSMQVNLKDGYGGIREANMLWWVANVVFGVKKTKYLVGKSYNKQEYRNYKNSLNFVFLTRNTLHFIAQKKLDIITYDILPKLSLAMNFQNEFLFMKSLFQALHTIHNFSSNMVKKLSSSIFFDKESIKKLKNYRFKKNIYIYEDTVFTPINRKSIGLKALLKELLNLPKDIKNFDRTYIYFASKTKIEEIDKKQLFNLLSDTNLYIFLKLLYNTNLINFVIPSFKQITNLAQFDGFHIHPVDIHTLNTLKFSYNIEDVFVKNLYKKFTNEQKIMLRLLCLFHDIGKGRKTDHHILGEMIFKRFLKYLNFDEEFIKTATTIVKYHNQMSKTASTEDIYSQKTVLNFIGLFRNIKEIELLYVLTYCDISAVDKKYFTSSISKLLFELYNQSILAFSNKDLIKESSRRAVRLNKIKTFEKYQKLPNSIKRKIPQIASNQIFLRLKSEDILDIAIKSKDVETYIFKIINDEYLKLRIIRKIPLNLGYLLGKLQYLDMNSMNIFKLYDEKKAFEISFSKPALEEELYLIEEIINSSFDMSKSINLKKPMILKNDIKIDLNHSDTLASMKINTKDQKGLFAYIAKVFDDYNIDIESAKLITTKGFTKDLLLIEKNKNFHQNIATILEILTS